MAYYLYSPEGKEYHYPTSGITQAAQDHSREEGEVMATTDPRVEYPPTNAPGVVLPREFNPELYYKDAVGRSAYLSNEIEKLEELLGEAHRERRMARAVIETYEIEAPKQAPESPKSQLYSDVEQSRRYDTP
jgi:hypothetical protein